MIIHHHSKPLITLLMNILMNAYKPINNTYILSFNQNTEYNHNNKASQYSHSLQRVHVKFDLLTYYLWFLGLDISTESPLLLVSRYMNLFKEVSKASFTIPWLVFRSLHPLGRGGEYWDVGCSCLWFGADHLALYFAMAVPSGTWLFYCILNFIPILCVVSCLLVVGIYYLDCVCISHILLI